MKLMEEGERIYWKYGSDEGMSYLMGWTRRRGRSKERKGEREIGGRDEGEGGEALTGSEYSTSLPDPRHADRMNHAYPPTWWKLRLLPH